MSEQDLHYVCWFYRPDDPRPLTEITAEVAITPRKRARGLSGHEALHPQGGMLFLAPDGPAERPETFHVGGVRFPFDIIFIRRDHKIGQIVHNVQPDDPGRWTYRRTSAVIEVVGGFCKSHGIKLGDEVGFGHSVRAKRTPLLLPRLRAASCTERCHGVGAGVTEHVGCDLALWWTEQQRLAQLPPTKCSTCGAPIGQDDYRSGRGECEACDERRNSSRAAQTEFGDYDRQQHDQAPEKTCGQCGRPFKDPYDSSPAGMCPSCSVDADDRAQSQPKESQQYNPAPGEEVITTATGRWQWMTGGQGGGTYMHLDCDCPTDQDGLCVCCRGASPAASKTAFRAAICPQCGTNRAIHPVGFGGAQGLGRTIKCLGCGHEGEWSKFDKHLTGRRAIRTIVDAGRRIAARFAQMQPISDVPSATPDNDSGGGSSDESRDDSGWDRDAQGSMPYDPAYAGGPGDCRGCGAKAEVDGPDGTPLCVSCYEGLHGPIEPEGQARSHDVLRTITEA